jgi:F-type H+-transporting ATPase subunit a
MSSRPLAISVEVGNHVTWKVFGWTWNVDTILGTLVAGGIIVALGLVMRARYSVTKPSGVQLFFETVTSQVEEQVEGSMGIKTAPFVVPLAVTLFTFILFANWLSIIPTGHHPEYMPPPASDVNLTYALAVLVVGWMHVTGIRKKGVRGYYHHLISGVIMVSLIALFPAYILWAPDIIWKLFDMFIGLIQAFIFALLTILYFSSVGSHDEHDDKLDPVTGHAAVEAQGEAAH